MRSRDALAITGCRAGFNRRSCEGVSFSAILRTVKGPPITVRCDCGEVAHVPYPETWQCPTCGRRWNTGQIPADEYYGILREMRRFRLTAIGAAVVFAVVFTVLAVAVSQSLLLLLPVVLAGWYVWYMPLWRRKVRRRARSLPKWQLRPE